jgi:hypothetical protein
VCAEILYREGFTWDIAFFFTLSRTYFAALAVFHSFLALKERRTQGFDEDIIYGATTHTNTFLYLLQRGGILQRAAGGTGDGTLASFGFRLQSHMSRSSSAVAHKSQMDQNDSRSTLQLMMCIARLIQLIDRFPCPRNVFGRA